MAPVDETPEDDSDIWVDEPDGSGEPDEALPPAPSVGADPPPAAGDARPVGSDDDDPWATRRATPEERAALKAEARRARQAARAERSAATRAAVAAEPSWLRYELRSAAELAGLTGFAVVQPVLGPYGESPETFVGAGAESGDIVRFALIVAIVPLVGLVVAAAATRVFGLAARRWVQTVLVGLLAGIAASALARHGGWGSPGRATAGLVVGLGIGFVHRRWEPGRLFLRYASPTPILLVASFLFASPVATVVSPPKPEVAKAAAASTGDHPDVVVLVLDELPTLSLVDGAGQIDAERFPNIARFADTSTWYRNHSAVAPETLLALPALTTGKMPLGGNNEPYADAESYPDTIFSLLGKTHRVHAVEWATDLCPASLCPEGDVELDEDSRALVEGSLDPRDPTGALLDSARSLWWDQADPLSGPARTTLSFPGADDSEQLALPALEFLSGLERTEGDAPTFDWLDVGLPHQPWRLLPDGGQYNGPQSPAGSVFLGWPNNPTGVQLALAARTDHLLQLQWTDRMLGAIFDRLEEIDRFDDALVVLTADHGVAFTAGQPIRDLTPENATQISYPPLFVKAPGQTEGSIDDGNAISLDLLPTVADYAGVDIPWKVDGMSLRDGAKRLDAVKVSVALDPTRFATRGFGDIVRLDVDGLGAVQASPFVEANEGITGVGDDDLNVYRYGRNGDLIGKRVADLDVCDGGPEVEYDPPPSWGAWVDGSLDRDHDKLPLYHEGRLDAPGSRDVVLAVDGVVAGWAPSRPDEDGNPFAVLLARPLAEEATGDPVPYEVQTGADCQLRRFDG